LNEYILECLFGTHCIASNNMGSPSVCQDVCATLSFLVKK
jgi:hypothetical protein